MALLLSVWKMVEEVKRTIDPATAWTIIAIEGGVIASLAAYIATQQKKHDKKITAMGEKINELYEKRLTDMKESIDIVETLEKVIYRERKGGKQ
jgi:hypothetical protein